MKALTLEQSQQLEQHAQIMTSLYSKMKAEGRELHDGQIQVAKAYFNDKKRIIQSQWGRNGGKSEAVLYIATVKALLYPGSKIYIICPERKQGKEIYWSSGRLCGYAPEEYIAQELGSELRLIFKNGSFICIDGCENAKAHRGVKPDLVFYDEFQDHSREFDLEIMRPNLLAKNSSLIITGTPPRNDCYYVEFKKQLLADIASGDTTRLYLQFPTSINPSVDKAELQRTMDALYRADNGAIVKREYLGEDCFGGEGVVFPFWSKTKHVRSHSVIMSYLERDKKKLKWVCFSDPGSSTCFAVLFAAYNPYTSQIFLLDEIYETDRKGTEPLRMWNRIQVKQQELFDGKWFNGYDSAEAWWKELVQQNFGIGMIPSAKTKRLIDDDIALMKSMMAGEDCLFVSERCVKFAWEVENFITDDKGNYMNGRDHLLDCVRYILRFVNYRFVEKVYRDKLERNQGGYTSSDPFVHNKSNLKDWADDIMSSVDNAPPWDTIFQ